MQNNKIWTAFIGQERRWASYRQLASTFALIYIFRWSQPPFVWPTPYIGRWIAKMNRTSKVIANSLSQLLKIFWLERFLQLLGFYKISSLTNLWLLLIFVLASTLSGSCQQEIFAILQIFSPECVFFLYKKKMRQVSSPTMTPCVLSFSTLHFI